MEFDADDMLLMIAVLNVYLEGEVLIGNDWGDTKAYALRERILNEYDVLWPKGDL